MKHSRVVWKENRERSNNRCRPCLPYYSRFICSRNEVNHEMPREIQIDPLSWLPPVPRHPKPSLLPLLYY